MSQTSTPRRSHVPSQLDARGIVVFRGERLVLDGIDLSCAGGGAVLLTGPNGAGKSTLLRILAGLRAPDAGSLLWNDAPVADDTLAHARRVAYLGHQDALKPGLTVAENLRLACITGGGGLDPALRAVALSDLRDLPARLLSAGQKRRAALARVLLLRATLWLLDEPSLGLDAHAVDLLGALLAQHRAEGGMVIATTHVPLPLPDAATLRLAG